MKVKQQPITHSSSYRKEEVKDTLIQLEFLSLTGADRQPKKRTKESLKNVPLHSSQLSTDKRSKQKLSIQHPYYLEDALILNLRGWRLLANKQKERKKHFRLWTEHQEWIHQRTDVCPSVKSVKSKPKVNHIHDQAESEINNYSSCVERKQQMIGHFFL